jgi:hypothetical protein
LPDQSHLITSYEKDTATKSYSKLSDSSPESRLVVGEKEPSSALQNTTPLKQRREDNRRYN